MEEHISILIADDHPLFRKGLRQVLEAESRFKIVGEAEDGKAALAQIEDHRPKVAVLDLDMPQLDGLQVTRAIHERRIPTEVICLTMHKDERFLNAALDAGVKGYVLKDAAVLEIVDAIKAVVSGQHHISSQLSTYLVNRRSRREELAGKQPGLDDLTETERKVLRLVADFKTTREIADALCISIRTADHHRANIAQKLQLHGMHALTRFAVEHRSAL
jgi:DNA-binding NarL/FixJ family response regulator